MARSAAEATRLEAAAAAKALHSQLDVRKRVIDGGGLVDVFGAIEDLSIPLVFKPLTSALGFCLPSPLKGIMVTTRRGLHIQRFTAAHELGHAVLEHRGSVDLEILERGPLSPTKGRDLQEVAADAFAAEFLLPRWLYRHHIQTQGWSVANDLQDPQTVYQLSLRMGASYNATCWGLLSHQILNRGDVDRLRKVQVAKLKEALGQSFRPGSSWSDVWRVTEKDNGAHIVGNPDDLIRIELKEASSSGYQWELDGLAEAGFEVLSDNASVPRTPIHYGEPIRRTVIARPPEFGEGDLVLRERQPWAPEESDPAFALGLALTGPEAGGLSRAQRRRLGIAS